MKQSIYDQPIMNPDWTKEQILDVFLHNQDFALTWFRLMTQKSKGRNMSMYQQEKIVSALREYINMLSFLLDNRIFEFEIDHEMLKT